MSSDPWIDILEIRLKAEKISLEIDELLISLAEKNGSTEVANKTREQMQLRISAIKQLEYTIKYKNKYLI